MKKPLNDKISWEIALIKKDFNTVVKEIIKKQKETLQHKDHDSSRLNRIAH